MWCFFLKATNCKKVEKERNQGVVAGLFRCCRRNLLLLNSPIPPSFSCAMFYAITKGKKSMRGICFRGPFGFQFEGCCLRFCRYLSPSSFSFRSLVWVPILIGCNSDAPFPKRAGNGLVVERYHFIGANDGCGVVIQTSDHR